MAFGDTITITIDSVAKVLKKINQDGYKSEYLLRETGQEFSLSIKNSKDRLIVNGFPRERHYVVFTQTVYAVEDTSPQFVRTMSFTLVNDKTDTFANVLLSSVGFVDFLTSANQQKLLDYES